MKKSKYDHSKRIEERENYWAHEKPKVSNRLYSWNEVKPKKRFDFGESDD